MEKRQQEIYDDIIRRRGSKNPLTKSQKKHLKHVAKNRVRSEKRKAKQLAEQEASGKLIEENHNGGDYSPEFTDKAANWHLTELSQHIDDQGERFLLFFRTRRPKYLDLVLKWNLQYPRDVRYEFFKGVLELYWDNTNDAEAIKNYTKSFMGNSYNVGI